MMQSLPTRLLSVLYPGVCPVAAHAHLLAFVAAKYPLGPTAATSCDSSCTHQGPPNLQYGRGKAQQNTTATSGIQERTTRSKRRSSDAGSGEKSAGGDGHPEDSNNDRPKRGRKAAPCPATGRSLLLVVCHVNVMHARYDQ